MAITSSSMGAFRFIGRQIYFNDLPLELQLFEVDQAVREHPYFQKVSNRVTLLFKHAKDFPEFTKNSFFVGREVIGPPLQGQLTENFVILDANASLALKKGLSISELLSEKEIFKIYSEVRQFNQGSEYADFWRVEFDIENANSATLHFPTENQKLFSQFVDN